MLKLGTMINVSMDNRILVENVGRVLPLSKRPCALPLHDFSSLKHQIFNANVPSRRQRCPSSIATRPSKKPRMQETRLARSIHSDQTLSGLGVITTDPFPLLKPTPQFWFPPMLKQDVAHGVCSDVHAMDIVLPSSTGLSLHSSWASETMEPLPRERVTTLFQLMDEPTHQLVSFTTVLMDTIECTSHLPLS